MLELVSLSYTQTSYLTNPDGVLDLVTTSASIITNTVSNPYWANVSTEASAYLTNQDGILQSFSLSGLISFSPISNTYYTPVHATVSYYLDNPDGILTLQLVNYVGVPSSGSAYTTTEGFSFGDW